jgi:myo-inositol-1(or 4)-monophosphatase
LNELLAVAERLAREAGVAALNGRRSGDLGTSTKSSPSDMVTKYDKLCETLIVGGIASARPDDAIVGEEGANKTGSTGIEWHIDPIDGTTNYIFDLPNWSVSIGVRDSDGPLVGAVYVPVLNEMFTAVRGGGSFRNGTPITPRDVTSVGDALVATGFSYDPAARSRHGRTVANMVGSIRDLRRLGAASVDICFVACGRLDAYVEGGLNSWDIMAAQLVATEAGCIVSAFDGGPVTPAEVIASSPAIHGGIVELFARATREAS